MILAKNKKLSTTELCTNPNGCMSNIKRHDLFMFVRWLMWITAIRSVPFEKYLPKNMAGCTTAINVVLEMFLLLTMVHIFVLFIFTFYFNYTYGQGDMGFLVSCFIQMLIYSWAIMIKVIFRRICPDLVYDIMDYVNAEHATHSAVGFTYVSMMECLKYLDTRIKIFVYCCFIGTSFWLVLPIVYQERTLPLPCWYPFDYKLPFIYPVVYFLQIVGQIQLAATFSFNSVYFFVLCFLLAGQFDVLNCSLKNIMATTYIYMGASKAELLALREQHSIANDAINQFFVAKELALDLNCIPHLMNARNSRRKITANFCDAFHRALAPCVKHQRFILNALGKIERLYSVVWYFKTVEATLAVCTIAFDVVKSIQCAVITLCETYPRSTNRKSFLQVLSLCQYLGLVLWEMFMICYGGEIIYVNSQRCGEALLRSPWYLHSREMRADLLFFLLNAQRAFVLTGAKLYPLKVEKFRQIITTSFSFFTLLQNMDQRN